MGARKRRTQPTPATDFRPIPADLVSDEIGVNSDGEFFRGTNLGQAVVRPDAGAISQPNQRTHDAACPFVVTRPHYPSKTRQSSSTDSTTGNHSGLLARNASIR
jgi:hypothetical protein